MFNMSDPVVRLEQDGALATITLLRPKAGNAISVQLARELRAAATTCADNGNIRAVLLNADGPAFCFGGDISEFLQAGDGRSGHVAALAEDLHAAQALLLGMSAPLVVAVQGAAAGAGVGLAVMGDIVVAAESASFTLAYTRIGVSPDGGATHFLPRLIGLRRTQELAFTNRRLTAREALDWGMVTSVSADADVQADARRIALQLATGATAAYGAVKRLLAQSFSGGFNTQTAREADAISALMGSQDAAEGLSAFAAKRDPNFTGGVPAADRSVTAAE